MKVCDDGPRKCDARCVALATRDGARRVAFAGRVAESAGNGRELPRLGESGPSVDSAAMR